MNDKLLASQKIDEFRLELRKLRHKKAWKEVYAQDAEIEKYTTGLENIDKKAIPQLEDVLSKAESQREEAEKAVDENAGSFEDITDRIKLIAREQKMLSDQVKQNQREQNRIFQQTRECENDIQEYTSNIDSLEQACEKMQSTAKEEISSKMKAYLDSLQKEEEALAAFVADVKEYETKLETLMRTLQDKDSNLQFLRDEEQTRGPQVENLRKQLKRIEAEGSNSVAALGRNMVQLMREIKRAENRFHKVPIGPIGEHTKLLDSRWATASCSGPHAKFCS